MGAGMDFQRLGQDGERLEIGQSAKLRHQLRLAPDPGHRPAVPGETASVWVVISKSSGA